MLNFEAATLKFCNHFWKFGCQPRKSKADFCMTNGSKADLFQCSDLFVFFIVPQRLTLVMQKERFQSQINQNFGRVIFPFVFWKNWRYKNTFRNQLTFKVVFIQRYTRHNKGLSINYVVSKLGIFDPLPPLLSFLLSKVYLVNCLGGYPPPPSTETT